MIKKIKWHIAEFRNAESKFAWFVDFWRFRYFALAHRRERPANLAFDRLHGVETAAELPLETVGVAEADLARGNSIYRPITEKLFRAAIASIDIRIEDFTFVDIGSGKGKILFMAADLPFRRIVGVEYAAGLHAVALRNLASFRSQTQQCRTLEAVHGDALEYPLPTGPLVLFIFNALAKDFMRQLLERLDAQVASDPARPLLLIYTNLRSVREVGDVFLGLGNLRPVRETRHYVVIANDAPGAPTP